MAALRAGAYTTDRVVFARRGGSRVLLYPAIEGSRGRTLDPSSGLELRLRSGLQDIVVSTQSDRLAHTVRVRVSRQALRRLHCRPFPRHRACHRYPPFQ
jgi:hypothetical protein